MNGGRFGSVITAMATPFDGDGALDLDGAVTLARWLADHGSDAIVATGTTGESPVLSRDEKSDLWRALAEALTIPVIAGSTTSDTAESVELTRRAAAAGVNGILAVGPYYSRPPQSGIEAHFRAVAAAADLPVLLYDIPIRTGRKVAHDTLLRLGREVPNIVGVKDATGDVAASARLIAEAPAGFQVYSGDDVLTLPLLAVGAVGIISVAAHWAGERIAEMIAAYFKGDVDHARLLNGSLIDSWNFETSELAPNPIPAKVMLRALGLPGGECRLPLGPAPAGLAERATEILAALAVRPRG